MKRVLIVLTAIALLAIPASAQDLATANAAGLTVTFETNANSHGWTLRVGTPDGQVFAQDFDGAETPFFTAVDDFGGVMADGSYTWELVAIPAPRERDTASVALEGRSQTGSFLLQGGSIIAGGNEEPLTRDQVFIDDLIVQGSACVGVDCTNGENFGFDTIRLKENNLRIKFQDTSASASFPSNDWQITANDSSNGGANKFSIDDIDAGRTPFTIEAGAQANTLYVEADGDVGIKTANPVVDLHIVEGNTPTLRLEQDGSDGFTPQTWDLAGNEANFFIRDVTNGSKLPVQIKPSAPTASIFIAADGDVGIGTASPDAPISVKRTDSTAVLAEFESNDSPGLRLSHTTFPGEEWDVRVNNQGSIVIDENGDGAEVIITRDSQMRINGQGTAPATCTAGAMYVDNSPSATLCFCASTNTWSIVSGSGDCT